ncbi:MAG: cell division protein FtsL [Shinella sp.]|uniref:cell division protein FtsL n=1 Tax=Shinella sp. TaxID=1870904 RepID=UPI00403508A6
MFRTLDVVMIAVMTAAATVTYSIKHQAENKLEVVRKLDSEIKLEEDTIDLLKADWALLTQPNRLNRLVKTFEADLKLVPTESTQLAQPSELPMPMAELPALEPEKDGKKDEKIAKNKKKASDADAIQTGSVAN